MQRVITEVTAMAGNVTSRASVLAMLHFVNVNTYIHRATHKKRELLKNPTKFEEIQENKNY
jgi:hypothetical protein